MHVHERCKECGTETELVECDLCKKRVPVKFAYEVQASGGQERNLAAGREYCQVVIKQFCSFACMKKYVSGSTIDDYLLY